METMPAVLTALILLSIAPTASAAGEPILDVCVTGRLGLCAQGGPAGISIARPAAAPSAAPPEEAPLVEVEAAADDPAPSPPASETGPSAAVAQADHAAAAPEADDDIGTAAIETSPSRVDARIPWALVAICAIVALFLFVLLLGARARREAKSTRFMDAVRADAMQEDIEAAWREARRPSGP